MPNNYDNWKQQTPPEELKSGCLYCGEATNGEFCSKECKTAYIAEN